MSCTDNAAKLARLCGQCEERVLVERSDWEVVVGASDAVNVNRGKRREDVLMRDGRRTG